MQLDEQTLCACVRCGYPVIGRHDCDRQLAENIDPETMNAFDRIIFMNARGELIARLAMMRRGQ